VGGMLAHDVLRAATIAGAEAIGHGSDFGSLEPGKLADLQVLDRNPLEDIHGTTSVRYVMKNGRLYHAEDLTELWPRRKPLASAYLWESSGERRGLPVVPHACSVGDSRRKPSRTLRDPRPPW
jgi:Amidohydrolase family